MRIDEIIREDQQDMMRFEKAWTLWIQKAGKSFSAADQTLIKREAQDAAKRGFEPMDAIGLGVELIRANKQSQKSAPKVASTPQKSAPEPKEPEEPEAKRSRGAQIGNQNAFKGGPAPTGVIGKTIQKGKEKAQKWGGIKQGAQRRSRKLNTL